MQFENKAYISSLAASLVALQAAGWAMAANALYIKRANFVACGMMCKLTLSGEPRPVYSILCDSPTLLPPSGKAAFGTELDFNNLSTENSSEMQRE